MKRSKEIELLDSLADDSTRVPELAGRSVAARSLLNVVPIRELVPIRPRIVSKTLRERAHENIIKAAYIQSSADWRKVESIVEGALTSSLSEDEIHAVAALLRTEVGRSAARKLGAVLREIDAETAAYFDALLAS